MTPYSEIKGLGYNIFGDRFHPIIASLASLYWIWNDPRMLGIALALVAASVYLLPRLRVLQGAAGALAGVPRWRKGPANAN